MPKSSSRIEQIKSGIANLIKRGGADNPLWDVATMPMAPLGPAVLGAARDPGNRAMGAVRGAAGSIGGAVAGSAVGGGLGLLADLLAHGKLPPEEAERVVAAVRRAMSGGIGSAAGAAAGIPIGTHMATAGHMAPDAAKQADAIMRQGFIDKCAELGIDPVRLCKIAQAVSMPEPPQVKPHVVGALPKPIVPPPLNPKVTAQMNAVKGRAVGAKPGEDQDSANLQKTPVKK